MTDSPLPPISGSISYVRWIFTRTLAPPSGRHLLKPLWSEEVQKMEEFLQVILQWGARQQQLMIYLVAIEDPEKLEIEARTAGERVISGKWLTQLTDISLARC